jgi:S1-C subfamily serine protease
MMALVLLFLGAATSQIVEHLAKPVSAAPLPDFRTMAREYGKVFRKAAENITPAVVNIVVFKKVENEAGVLEDELGLPFNFHHRKASELKQQGVGSGLIIDARHGYIMTNGHVVAAGTDWLIKLPDQREFEAELVGVDQPTDVAILKINASGLVQAKLGNSNSLEVGDWVLAVGNPYGLLEQTVTAGIISAKDRRGLGSSAFDDYLQTDAAINIGNSGGPLVNLDGDVVGMNTAIMSASGGFQGLGFAIPINRAKAIADKLIRDGSVIRGWISIETKDSRSKNGVPIETVPENGPAKVAGLKPGDVVTRFGGKPIHDTFELRDSVCSTEPGTRVRVEVKRGAEHRTLYVTVGTQPKDWGYRLAGHDRM